MGKPKVEMSGSTRLKAGAERVSINTNEHASAFVAAAVSAANPLASQPPIMRTRPVVSWDSGRADQRNNLAFVPAVNAKVLIHGDDTVIWE